MELSFDPSPWPILLLVVWAGLLFGGFLFGRDPARTRRMPVWTRMASSATLVAAAWFWAWLAAGTLAQTYGRFIAAGMTLGFLGDLFMAKLLPVPKHVLWGMGAFGLGHVAYIAGMIAVGTQLPQLTPVLWLPVVAWWLLGAVLCYWIVLRGREWTLLHRAALPYALLLASTAGVASGLAIQEPAFVPLAVGAVLFLVSDLILATQLFNAAHFPYIGDVIWLTYGPGQMLIVYTMWTVLAMAA